MAILPSSGVRRLRKAGKAKRRRSRKTFTLRGINLRKRLSRKRRTLSAKARTRLRRALKK